MSQLLRFPVLVLVACAWMVNGCGDRAISGGGQNDRCDYGGATYQTGNEFCAEDGCNSCQCNPEGTVGIACTQKDCSAGGAVVADICKRKPGLSTNGVTLSISQARLALSCCDGGCEWEVLGHLYIDISATNTGSTDRQIKATRVSLATVKTVWTDQRIYLAHNPEYENIYEVFGGVVTPGQKADLHVYTAPEWTKDEADALDIYSSTKYKIELVLEVDGQEVKVKHEFKGADSCGWR